MFFIPFCFIFPLPKLSKLSKLSNFDFLGRTFTGFQAMDFAEAEVLRGEKLQNIRFIAMLIKALDS